MISVRSSALAFTVICSALVALSAAQSTPASLGQCERRTLVVTVSDKTGPVMNLDKSNFLVESKSGKLNVVAARVRRTAPRVIVVIDLSGSMSERSKRPVITSLAQGFLEAAPPKAPLGLVTFNHKVKDRMDFSTPRETIIQKLEEIGGKHAKIPLARTALFDALNEVVQMFGEPQSGDFIFLISDGSDNSSHVRSVTVKEQLLEHGVRLYSFAPIENMFQLEVVRTYANDLDDLARETGGRSMTMENLSSTLEWKNSPEVLARDREMGKYMYVLATSSYELDVESDRAVPGSPLKLNLVGPDGKQLHDMYSLYPHELTPCLQPEHR